MCGYHPTANPNTLCDYLDNDGVPDGLAEVNRFPDQDDILGIQTLYGAAPVPEPRGTALMLAGLGALALLGRRAKARAQTHTRQAQNRK